MGMREFAALDGVQGVFADTSYFFALLNDKDPNHERAMELSDEVRDRSIRVLTTWEIVFESVALLRYRASYEIARIFLTQVMPGLRVLLTSDEERRKAVDVFLQRSRDRRLSLCDVLSYFVISTRLEWLPCLSFDDDFIALGLTVVR